MTTRKKNTAAAVPAEAANAAGGAPASAPAEKPPSSRTAAPKKAPSKPAKAPDPAVQSSREALAKALATAQAVKIEQPLGKPAKAEREVKAKAEKAPKARKAKLVRDSFTMPENEYARIGELKKRLLARGRAAKKSELLRAGVALLAALEDAALVAVMEKVEVIKTGRPAKSAR